MSTSGDKPPPPASQGSSSSGVRAALRYSGLPVWLAKRPKLPSRNWLIFIGVTSSVLGLYTYDRKKCKDIREKYIRRVAHLAQEPMDSMELPRKVTVYACKWPGDEDVNRSLKYFRKYVKPVLVAAAIDYDVINGRRHGDLARQISDKINANRRIDEGLEAPTSSRVPTPTRYSKEELAIRELQGGSIVIGRMTFKEYMEGLKRGWTESPKRIDREERLAHELEGDGRFDEPEPENSVSDPSGEPIPTKSRLMSVESARAFSPYKLASQSNATSPSVSSTSVIPPPETIPPQPPLLLVPFTNRIGFRQIPMMIVDFFNQRAKVKAGAEAAYRLVMAHARPISGPPPSPTGAPLFSPDERLPENDLDFDRLGESYYQKSVLSFRDNILKTREDYYRTLPERLATARALARGEREPTKEETNHPPLTEVELRQERLTKEMRWRNNEEGWEIIRPDKDVAWDERFRGSLSIFTDPPEEPTNENSQ
ncbi:TIM54 [Sanghuangporus sanghuang]